MKKKLKVEKKIDTIIALTGEFPKELEITKEEYEELAINDDKFMNVKLIKNRRCSHE